MKRIRFRNTVHGQSDRIGALQKTTGSVSGLVQKSFYPHPTLLSLFYIWLNWFAPMDTLDSLYLFPASFIPTVFFIQVRPLLPREHESLIGTSKPLNHEPLFRMWNHSDRNVLTCLFMNKNSLHSAQPISICSHFVSFPCPVHNLHHNCILVLSIGVFFMIFNNFFK